MADAVTTRGWERGIEQSSLSLLLRMLGDIPQDLVGADPAVSRMRRFSLACRQLRRQGGRNHTITSISKDLTDHGVAGLQQSNLSVWLRGRRKNPLSSDQLEALASRLHIHPLWLERGDKDHAPLHAFVIPDEVLHAARWITAYLAAIPNEATAAQHLVRGHASEDIEAGVNEVYRGVHIDKAAFVKVVRATKVELPTMLSWEERRLLLLGLARLVPGNNPVRRVMMRLASKLAASLVDTADSPAKSGLAAMERQLLKKFQIASRSRRDGKAAK